MSAPPPCVGSLRDDDDADDGATEGAATDGAGAGGAAEACGITESDGFRDWASGNGCGCGCGWVAGGDGGEKRADAAAEAPAGTAYGDAAWEIPAPDGRA